MSNPIKTGSGKDDKGNRIETGLKKFGAMIGDNVEVGCGSILNPGTVVGPDSNIYPLSSVREVIPGTVSTKNAAKSQKNC